MTISKVLDGFFGSAFDGEQFCVFQLIKASDGIRTGWVRVPLVSLVEVLESIQDKDDFINLLFSSAVDEFSLKPLMRVSTFLEHVVANPKLIFGEGDI